MGLISVSGRAVACAAVGAKGPLDSMDAHGCHPLHPQRETQDCELDHIFNKHSCQALREGVRNPFSALAKPSPARSFPQLSAYRLCWVLIPHECLYLPLVTAAWCCCHHTGSWVHGALWSHHHLRKAVISPMPVAAGVWDLSITPHLPGEASPELAGKIHAHPNRWSQTDLITWNRRGIWIRRDLWRY